LLPAFLDGLRAQEHKVGTRQHIAVQELVGEMVARDFVPDSFADFGDWLAPLLCTSRQEQEEFHRQFQRWLLDNDFAKEEEVARLGEDERPAVTHAEAEGARVTLKVDTPSKPPPPDIRERARRLLRTIAGPRPLRRVSAACALLLGLALIGWAAYSINKARLVADALTPDTLDPELSRQIAAFYTPVPAPSPTPLPTPDDQQIKGRKVEPPPPPPTPTPTPKVGYAYDLTKSRESPTERPDLTKVGPDMTPPPETLTHKAFPVVLVAAPALPLLWFGAWLYRLRKRRAEQAARWQPGKRPHLDKIKVKGPRERVFGSSWLRRAAREMRRHRRTASVQLDARETVHATARRAGLFTPSYGLRRTLPEYLVLIDRASFTDQLAQLNSEVVRRLVENDVYVDAYYFVGDPVRCHDWREETPPASLQDLAAHYPDHRLIVFSEGEGLINPHTGRPQRSVGQFAFWEQRALLTTVPPAQWGERESALMKSGLAVLPADADGLRALADAVNIGAPPRVPGAPPAPPYPSILRERLDLWKERAAPPAHQSARLLSQLHRYLGPGGYELLCACAVYPMLQWGVTVYLAAELLEPAEAERTVRALVRLPWFRHGTMPEWLRVQLIEELPAERRRLVRERLELLLLNFIEDPLKGLRLSPVRGSTTRRATGLFGRLAVRRRRRRLRRLIEHAPPRSPVSDPVFVNFITSNRLALRLPERLLRSIFRRGVLAYGPRTAPALVVALVVALAALSLLLLTRPDDDLSARGWPDITCPLFCPHESGKTPASEPFDFAYTPTFGARGQSINLDVYALKDGEYDFSKMRLRLKDDAAGGLTVQLRRATAQRLYKQINVAPDAPLGETTLLLYDGDRFRASLPFTITTAAPTPSPSPTPGRCPTIVINVVGSGGDEFPTGDDLFYADLINIPPGIGSLTYNWKTTGEVSIRSGQGTSPVRVAVDGPIPTAGRKQADIREHTLSLIFSLALTDPASVVANKQPLLRMLEILHFNVRQTVKEILLYCVRRGYQLRAFVHCSA
jgi:hypothetical protein